MHPAGKIFVAIGVFVLLGGVVLMVIGGGNIEDAGEGFESLEEFTLENATSGTLSVDDKDGYGDLGFSFWVKGDYTDDDGEGTWDHCQSTTINITTVPETNPEWDAGVDGDFYHEVYEGDACRATDDNRDDSRQNEGLVKVGRACLACYEGDMVFESNVEVWVIYEDEIIGEVLESLGEGVEGVFQGAAGVMLLCCGGVITIFGLILGLLVNNNQKTIIVQNGAMPGNAMQANQTMVTQPVYQKSYADVPVQPQTTMQQPQQEGFWNQEEPKNPF
ncbi:hypothetical protein N9K60_01630 [Candidatus Poseidoniales archaeon]|nr:hypothetical protein [Candidatus Poseidoniales archaeon]